MIMKIIKILTVLSAVALLAGCGPSGAIPRVSPVSPPVPVVKPVSLKETDIKGKSKGAELLRAFVALDNDRSNPDKLQKICDIFCGMQAESKKPDDPGRK
jgi:hypothetical protein